MKIQELLTRLSIELNRAMDTQMRELLGDRLGCNSDR